MWRGECRDEGCRAPLLFTRYEDSITCAACGQEQPTSTTKRQFPVDDPPHPLTVYIPRNVNLPPRPADLVKVGGLSNYHCKLISPLFTTHGMDKHSGKAKLLRHLTGRATLDCSVFGDRSFRIDAKYLNVRGFGIDEDAQNYLSDTLHLIKPFNEDKVSMVALQTDGDGHCLVHAVSRALVGYELFWHPLRVGLKHHFNLNLDKYKSLLGNFIDSNEWVSIIAECEPEYRPGDGSMVGLRNIHVFGLANLLRRPIILLDCLAGINASADYAAVFLPGLNPPMACSNKAGQLNPPICLAWSSAARNHYVPLVPIKDQPLPRVPVHFLPKVWGFPQDLLDSYIKFDDQNCVIIGSDNYLSESYIGRLCKAMNEQFLALNNVPPSIVSDLYYYHYSSKLLTEPKQETMVEVGAQMLAERRLLRCLCCRSLCVVPLNSQSLRPNGVLYVAAKKIFGYLRENHHYSFQVYGITCVYDSTRNMLVVNSFTPNMRCNFCQGSKLRFILSDGLVGYKNGDVTFTTVTNLKKVRCKCGYKHYWDGVEYDNPPIDIHIELEMVNKRVSDTVYWIQDESDPERNTKIYDLATSLLRNHFRDELENLENEKVLNCIVEQLSQVTKNLSGSEHDMKKGYESCGSGDESEGSSSGRSGRKREASDDDSGPPAKRSPSAELELTPLFLHHTSSSGSSPHPDSPGPSTSRQHAS